MESTTLALIQRGYNEGRIVDEISRDHGVRREIVRADVTEFIASEILAMPGNDGLGLENGRRRLPIVPPPGEPDSEDTIRPAEAKLVATARTPQHQKLMAEGKNLCLQNKARSETISETGEKSQHFFGKVTHQGFQNAMISTRTEFW